MAEARELKRIPNHIVKVKGQVNLVNMPSTYVLGKGHVRFFYNKLKYLHRRYRYILSELGKRKLANVNRWPDQVNQYVHLFNNYVPTDEAYCINQKRIEERKPKSPRYYRKKID